MNRVQEMVSKRGKKVLAWDEIAHADMNPNTIVQFWARPKNAILGIEKGAKVLMSPSKNAYLDMQYDSASIYGLHWAAYIEVDDAYNWDPSTLFAEISRENIVGIEAPLWTETVSNLAEAQYLIFPRLPGYAEIGWTPSSLRKWEEYRVRLAHHGLRMKASNINFYPSGKVDWELLKGGDIK
jgi:hexosaminidase